MAADFNLDNHYREYEYDPKTGEIEKRPKKQKRLTSMLEVRNNWNDYYADKQWIDTKGWCDLDGNPYNFEKRRFFHRKSSKNKSLYAEKVSFFGALFRAIKRLIALFFIYILVISLSNLQGTENIAIVITGIWCVATLGIVLHFIYFIIRCIIDHNLRL